MKISKSKQHWFVADFETTGVNEYERTGRTRVWLYSICDENSNIVDDGTDISSFMRWCENHHGSLIYFHNLKFDGTFILCWLIENNFQRQEKLTAHSKRGFSTLIGDMGEFYELKINFAPNKQVTIYDSLKLIPMTVKKIAEAFELPIEKEIIDYDVYDVNPTTIHYVHNDVKVVAMALKFFRDQGYYRMTIGSNSYHSFMDNFVISKSMFPKLEREWINEWRQAYRGGRSQVNPLFADKILRNVKRFDINSMYPYVMSEMPLPYGEPLHMKEPGGMRFELYHVYMMFKVKDGHLPTLLKTHSLYNKAGETYYTEAVVPLELWISNIDLDIMRKHYDIYMLKYVDVYAFKTARYIFKQWVEEHYRLKSESKGGLRLVYKLILNSLYGKFGSKAQGRNKLPYLDENGVLKYEMSDEHEMGIYYLPMAIAITSWAHKLIDDAIMETGMDNFVYCDTDSIHTLGTLPDEWIDQKKLGKFKLEACEELSKYIRQKTYIYKQDGKWEITCAGMPIVLKDYLVEQYGDDVINQFKVGLSVTLDSPNIKPNQLRLLPKQVPGGTILVPSPFSLL